MLKNNDKKQKRMGLAAKTNVKAGTEALCVLNDFACKWFGDQDACWQVEHGGICETHG